MNTPQDSTEKRAEEKEDLRDILEHELYEMLKVTSLMQPKSDKEFIAVALPNLHIRLFHFMEKVQEEERNRIQELLTKYFDVEPCDEYMDTCDNCNFFKDLSNKDI